MKKRNLIILLSLILSISGHSFAQTKAEKKAAIAAKVKTEIDSKDYIIDVSTAIPLRGRVMLLSGGYSLMIKGDSVSSYLPFFGEAYSLPYDGGEGLIFDSTSREYTIKYSKRKNAEISFSVRTQEDDYKITITISADGSSYVTFLPINKQSISFDGQLRLE